MNFSLIIIGIFIVLSIAFYFVRLFLFNSWLKKNGVVAEAVLLGMQESGNLLNDRLHVVIQLQVEPVQGKKFVTEIRQKMQRTEVNKLHPGRRVKVLFNPANHKQLVIC